jgi:ribosomal protein L23
MKSLREMIDIVEGQDVASAEVLLKRYELLTQSIRNAIDQRDYNEKFKHIEQIRDALEKHYGIDPDKMNEEATPDAVQEYTVRVVDSANKTYTVKVTAPSEEGAKHKAVVQVRNEYGVRPEGVRIINQDIEEEATPDAVQKINKLFQDKK